MMAHLAQLTRRERQIMDIVYRRGQATAAEVMDDAGVREQAAWAPGRIEHEDGVRALKASHLTPDRDRAHHPRGAYNTS